MQDLRTISIMMSDMLASTLRMEMLMHGIYAMELSIAGKMEEDDLNPILERVNTLIAANIQLSRMNTNAH